MMTRQSKLTQPALLPREGSRRAPVAAELTPAGPCRACGRPFLRSGWTPFRFQGGRCGPVVRRRSGRRPISMGGDVSKHVPVMLNEVVEAIAPRPGGSYVDCTFGRGGHARAVLERIGPGGRVLAIDRDPRAVAAARELSRVDGRVSVYHARFSEVGRIVDAAGLTGRIDAALMDLGVSSPQLDESERGFSFLGDGPLDMRMDPGSGVSAAEWLAGASEREIGRVLRELGEERAARRIARAIVAERSRGAPVASTRRLGAIIANAVQGGGPQSRASRHAQLPGDSHARERRAPRARERTGGDTSTAGSGRAARGPQLPLSRRPNRQALHEGAQLDPRAPAPSADPRFGRCHWPHGRPRAGASTE